MSVRLHAAGGVMRLTLKRRLNANYDLAQARRRFSKNKLAAPIQHHGGVRLEHRGERSAPNIILYIPGAGFALGVDDSHRRLVDELCRRTDARGCLLHYRLAPEHPFPAAHDDAADALATAVAMRDGGRLTVVADSAGASLAIPAVLGWTARRGAPEALVLISPLTDLAMTGLSHVYNRYRDPLFGPEAVIHKAHHYLQGANPTDARVSPLWGDLTGMPPTLVIVGGSEVMLEDSTRLVAKMRSAGGQAELHIVAECPHTFPLLVPWAPEARQAVATIARFIGA